MGNYGQHSNDSSVSLFRRRTMRTRHASRIYRPWVMQSSQRMSLYMPHTLRLMNKPSGYQDVKNALRRMRSSGTRKIFIKVNKVP